MGREILLVFLSAAGLLLGAFRLYGSLLRPVARPGCWAVIPGRGEGEGLEQRLRALVWLKSLGLSDSIPVIADVDLTPAGRELAAHLVRRWPQVVLVEADRLSLYIKQLT